MTAQNERFLAIEEYEAAINEQSRVRLRLEAADERLRTASRRLARAELEVEA